MALGTAQKLQKRYARFHAGHAADEDMARCVVAFLEALPLSSRRSAYSALRRTLSLDWSRVPKPRRYQRDETRLRATVLSDGERGRLAKLSVRERAMLYVCYCVRRAEAASLQWGDFRAGTLYVRKGKGGKARSVVLPESVSVALQEWHNAAPPADPTDPIFPTRHGEPAEPDRLGEWVRDTLRRVGLWIPGRGAHAFRRTFATEFLRRNPAELRRLQLLMGHANLGTTMLYDYGNPEEFRPALSNLKL